MKKIIIVLFMTMFLCSCSWNKNESNNSDLAIYSTRNNQILENLNLIYINSDLDISLELPMEWQEEVGIIEKCESVTFFYLNNENLFIPIFEIESASKAKRFDVDNIGDEKFVKNIDEVINSLTYFSGIDEKLFEPYVTINTVEILDEKSYEKKYKTVTIATKDEYGYYKYNDGVIDQYGNMIVEPKYNYLTEYEGETTIGSVDSTYYIIDSDGDVRFKTTDMILLNCSQNKIAFAYRDNNKPFEYGDSGYLDIFGEIVIPAKFKRTFEFSEDIAAVEDFNDNYGYIDIKGNYVIPPIYSYASPFKNGIAFVKVYNQGYFIDHTGKKIIISEEEKTWANIDKKSNH